MALESESRTLVVIYIILFGITNLLRRAISDVLYCNRMSLLFKLISQKECSAIQELSVSNILCLCITNTIPLNQHNNDC